MRRMLNQLSTPPVPTGAEEPWGSRGRSRGRIRLEREFHDDLSFWCLMVDTAVGPGGSGTLGAPLLNLYLQPHSRTLMSDASGGAMVGGCHGRFLLGNGGGGESISTPTPGAAFVRECSRENICLIKSLYLSRMKSQRVHWVCWMSTSTYIQYKERFNVKNIHTYRS